MTDSELEYPLTDKWVIWFHKVNDDKFHFYVQIVCLERDGKNYKYRAGIETGLLVWTNDISPEVAARSLRDKIKP